MRYEEILRSEAARKNFVLGLIRLAKVDGIISQEEQQFFIATARSLSLSDDDLAEIITCLTVNADIKFDFETPVEKILFFREGIQLCSVDNSYDKKERFAIRCMAKELSVPLQVIDEIEAWVEEGMNWKNRGDDLLMKCADKFMNS